MKFNYLDELLDKDIQKYLVKLFEIDKKSEIKKFKRI